MNEELYNTAMVLETYRERLQQREMEIILTTAKNKQLTLELEKYKNKFGVIVEEVEAN